MATLDWYDPTDQAYISMDAPIKNGKVVILRGHGYPGNQKPKNFDLFLIPSPAVSFGLSKIGKTPLKSGSHCHVRSVQARRVKADVGVAYDSPKLKVATARLTGRRRFVFTDAFGNRSPLLRVVRVCSFKSAGVTVLGNGADVGIEVQTPVDPTLRIELGVPWNSEWSLTPESVLREEINDLAEYTGEPGVTDEVWPVLSQALADFFPSERPEDVDYQWEPPRFEDLPDGARESFEWSVRASSSFAFCFFAVDDAKGEVVGTSNVALLWHDPSGGVTVVGADERPLPPGFPAQT